MPTPLLATPFSKLRLLDYSPPEYFTPETHLVFHIVDRTRVEVNVALFVQRNGTSMPSASFVLNCHESVQIANVFINGEELDPDQYRKEKDMLTILQSFPADFRIKIDCVLNPEANKSGKGLYVSGGNLVTQCEPHGFQWIAPSIDRPDNMGVFTTTLIADKNRFPILLSNGNSTEEQELPGNKYSVTFHDPFPKPSYLFALSAGDFDSMEDVFTTMSGKEVRLKIFTEKGEINQCRHAMESLKKSMKWDEERFCLECDLNEFKIVVCHDFNSGAMENKGLNIFNSSCAYADPKTATDSDFENVERVIAHEYFHNWTGDRVTCHDWFQLTLKEGLTVFRDQEFTCDTHSRALKRIDDAHIIKVAQFSEDGGPNAHPIRPQEVETIDNFYTTTVYDKGAEVIRMIFTMIGKDVFCKGLNLYLSRHDGQAVTTDEFVDAMQEVSGLDLTQFRNTWYSQKGTPTVHVQEEYDADLKTYKLHIEQKPAHEGQKPFHFPFMMGLLSHDGKEIPIQNNLLQIREPKHTFTFTDIPLKPTLSALRNFSAPVRLKLEQSSEELRRLMMHDSDLYNRYDAAQRYGKILLHLLIADTSSLNTDNLDAYGAMLDSVDTDPDFAARIVLLPSLREIVQEMDVYDYDSAYNAREFLMRAIAEKYEDRLVALYEKYHSIDPYKLDPKDIAARRIKNVCLAYLSKITGKHTNLLMKQFHDATNMTDQENAFRLLCNEKGPERDEAIASFYDQWKHDKLVFCKWVEAQSVSKRMDIIERMEEMEKLPEFDTRNPNNIRSLSACFAAINKVHFHDISGDGYVFVADHVIDIDSFNPQMAGGLVKRFDEYKKMDCVRQELMKKELLRIEKKTKTTNVREIVGNIVGE